MQLKKASIRHTPTYNSETEPSGISRKPEDYNQRSNFQQVHRNAHGDTFDAKTRKL